VERERTSTTTVGLALRPVSPEWATSGPDRAEAGHDMETDAHRLGARPRSVSGYHDVSSGIAAGITSPLSRFRYSDAWREVWREDATSCCGFMNTPSSASC
jgi:hypothetical protein